MCECDGFQALCRESVLNTHHLLKHFSEFSEVYAVPGDIATKGITFLEEAERLWDQEEKIASLTTLQGTLLLFEWYESLCDHTSLSFPLF